jgi:hypothetical protein
VFSCGDYCSQRGWTDRSINRSGVKATPTLHGWAACWLESGPIGPLISWRLVVNVATRPAPMPAARASRLPAAESATDISATKPLVTLEDRGRFLSGQLRAKARNREKTLPEGRLPPKAPQSFARIVWLPTESYSGTERGART